MNRIKIAFVTGTSSGFGKRFVERLLEDPTWKVVASLRGGETRAKSVFSAELLREAGDRLKFWDLDLSEKLDTKKLAEHWKANFGTQLDLLVNNAGYGMLGPSFEQSSSDIRAQFEVNFFSPITLTQALVPFFPLEGGRVINLSSICGLASFPYYGPYCASKYALEAYTESLGYELRSRGVQFCLVEPGAFRTEFNQRAKTELAKTESASGRFSFETEKKAFAKFLVEKKDLAGNPEKVVNLLIRLSNARRIPLRLTVGTDAGVFSFGKKYLPMRLWTWITQIAFQKIALKG